MAIFIEDKKDGKLKKLHSYTATKEKEIQNLIERNLLEVLDMHFLATEYTTNGGRIDTLAVDRNGAPVIIEYKRNKNDNIINQGLSYLRWLQAQKIEFFQMLILKKFGDEFLKSFIIDWKNPRVICIAESYNKFDIDTVEVIPMRIELFKYRYYDNGIFSLEPINVNEQIQKSNNDLTTNVESELLNLNLDSHLIKANENIKDLFKDLRSKIFELDENIIEKITTLYVAYRLAKNFVEIHIAKNHLKIHLRPIDYNDPENLVEKISDKYQWTMDRRIYLKNEESMDYVFNIIEQSYKDVI
ncbi:DUF5655 domain-containing protein [Chryseobacterium gambrini]|uniref:DUF5655 domain-containing protein n=1 Tax=Chryseobacterium gambrini TaxID=373672 RepID=UPI0022F3FBBA|nr:DUF5655 domain-containing protein [Chryseobacterium gambrini]WBX98986.1 endonuclease NucS [Chryseobacterium gambrini]